MIGRAADREMWDALAVGTTGVKQAVGRRFEQAKRGIR